jgi:hypothetical protein
MLFAVVEMGPPPFPLTVTKNRLSHRKRRKTKRVDRDVAVVAGGLTLEFLSLPASHLCHQGLG